MPGAGGSSDDAAVLARPLPAYVSPVRVRLTAAVVLAVCGATLSVAAWLRPESRGFGTHQQLGMGVCGWLVATGLPCPSCGMTTAFAHTVRGQWIAAFLAQPCGFLLALGCLVAIPLSLWSLWRGEPPRVQLPWLSTLHWLFIFMGVFVGGWGFKIAYGLATGQLPVTAWR